MAVPPESASPALTDRWSINPLIDLHWSDWGDDSVVFDSCSGQMFQFDALSAAIMACFEDGMCCLDEVVAAVAGDLGMPPDPELGETVSAVVEQYRRLGWLEPIIPG
jgi:PqqD family protein of HPr-rel-A system